MINSQNYTTEQIDAELRASDGSRKVSFRYDLLNRYEIKIGVLDGIEKASVTHNELRAIKRSASFELNEYLQREINFMTDRVQPWFILHMPDGGVVEWSLGIYLMESPARQVNGVNKKRGINAYDKTLILDQYALQHRQYFSAGTSYVAAINQLLAMGGLSNVNIESAPFEFQTSREFAAGTNARIAVNQLLEEINYTSLSIDETGAARAAPYVLPAKRPVNINYAAGRDSIIAHGYTDSLDIASRANVFVAVAKNLNRETPLISVYENTSPASPISIVNRGRRITDFREVNEAYNQNTLDSFVMRLAVESASALRHLDFSTMLMPTHGSADTLYIDIPELFETAMKFSETEWHMNLTASGMMTHKARVVVDI